MDIKLLSGALGAEVDGINLKDSSDKNSGYLSKSNQMVGPGPRTQGCAGPSHLVRFSDILV